jgi:hypothetical protein
MHDVSQDNACDHRQFGPEAHRNAGAFNAVFSFWWTSRYCGSASSALSLRHVQNPSATAVQCESAHEAGMHVILELTISFLVFKQGSATPFKRAIRHTHTPDLLTSCSVGDSAVQAAMATKVRVKTHNVFVLAIKTLVHSSLHLAHVPFVLLYILLQVQITVELLEKLAGIRPKHSAKQQQQQQQRQKQQQLQQQQLSRWACSPSTLLGRHRLR